MGKKAQMFIVTAVFLSSTLFFLQQALVTYASIDSTKAFRAKEVYVMKNVHDSVTETITSADDGIAGCQQFQKNLDELISLLKDDMSSDGFIIEADYNIDCSLWANNYPSPVPLSLSLRLSETYDVSGNMFAFYHIPTTDENICMIADGGGLCDGLDISYSHGYKSGCCTQHGFCC
jgi:hypothetical protein